MNVSIGERWEGFVERIVRSGRYGSGSEVVREGLRLVEEREARLAALREKLDASIVAGGEVSNDELDVAIAAKAGELRAKGQGPLGGRRSSPVSELICSKFLPTSPKGAGVSRSRNLSWRTCVRDADHLFFLGYAAVFPALASARVTRQSAGQGPRPTLHGDGASACKPVDSTDVLNYENIKQTWRPSPVRPPAPYSHGHDGGGRALPINLQRASGLALTNRRGGCR